jgi:hypothetical protein
MQPTFGRIYTIFSVREPSQISNYAKLTRTQIKYTFLTAIVVFELGYITLRKLF